MFWKLFGYKQTETAGIELTFIVLIPYLLYISTTDIVNLTTAKRGHAKFWSIHITPFFLFSIAGRAEKTYGRKKI